MKNIINTAKKIAFRDGYNQVIVREDNSFTICRDYEDNSTIVNGTPIAKIIHYWENGIAMVNVIE